MHQALEEQWRPGTRDPTTEVASCMELILGSGCHAGREEGREIKTYISESAERLLDNKS